MRLPSGLQARLALGLGLALSLLWLGAAAFTALSLRHEMQEVFDSVLQETAQRLLPLAVLEITNREEGATAQRLAPIREHPEFFTYLVRDADGAVLMRSHAADPTLFPDWDGPGFRQTDTHRFYAESALQGSIRLIVAEPLAHRQGILAEILMRQILPLVLVIPLTLGVVGIAVRLGLGGLRRWGWIAALAVLAPLAGGVLIHAAGAPSSGLALLILAVIAMATALPGGALLPRAEGPMIHQARRARPAPEVLVAALAVLAGVLALVSQVKAPESILAAGALALFLPLWTRRAPALSDLSLIAAAALPAAIALSHLSTPLLLAYVLNAYRWLPIAAVALAALAGLAMVWRSEAATARARDLWALLAVATPGATAIAAELFWQPLVLLEFRWPATIMALAAGLTGLALWAARRDGGQGLRLGAATAAAVAMIALALMLLLSEAALTVALAVLMVASAAMDRRFDIPALGVILGLGAMTLGWRLVVDPGLDPLMSGAMNGLDTALTLLAVLAGPLAALALIRQAPAHPARDWGRIIAETALSGAVPIIIAVVLARMLDRVSVHAMLGIEGTALIALAWVQAARARRMAGSRAMHLVRRALAVLLGLGAGLALLLAVTLFSPVFGGGFLSDPVQGWPLVNDLALAYGLPALVLWWAVRGAGGRLARGARLAAILLGAVWIGHVIRHLWQGGAQMPLYHGFAQGELYAYTVALLIAGAASMTLALRLGVTTYRRVGLALIGLAAAKAFLIDAAGLTGLMRVGAFLGLGLSLAALAWLNAWVIARSGGGDGASRG